VWGYPERERGKSGDLDPCLRMGFLERGGAEPHSESGGTRERTRTHEVWGYASGDGIQEACSFQNFAQLFQAKL
jgi:hypothetical protein